MNDAEQRAADILSRACNLYCDWYDHGKPKKCMNAEGCAYQLVSSCRNALAVLMDQPKGIAPAVDTFEETLNESPLGNATIFCTGRVVQMIYDSEAEAVACWKYLVPVSDPEQTIDEGE